MRAGEIWIPRQVTHCHISTPMPSSIAARARLKCHNSVSHRVDSHAVLSDTRRAECSRLLRRKGMVSSCSRMHSRRCRRACRATRRKAYRFRARVMQMPSMPSGCARDRTFRIMGLNSRGLCSPASAEPACPPATPTSSSLDGGAGWQHFAGSDAVRCPATT